MLRLEALDFPPTSLHCWVQNGISRFGVTLDLRLGQLGTLEKKSVWLQYQFVLVIQTNCKHFYSFLGQYINSCGSTQMKCFIWVELNRSNFDFSDYGKMQYLRLWQNGQFCRCDFSVWGAPASLKWCIEVVLSIYFCHKAGTDSKFSQ